MLQNVAMTDATSEPDPSAGEAPGEVTPGHDVDPAALRAAVEEVHGG